MWSITTMKPQLRFLWGHKKPNIKCRKMFSPKQGHFPLKIFASEYRNSALNMAKP
jgi:hypothetical protein